MRIYGERYCRDRRRYDLALRLIVHEARTAHHLCLDRIVAAAGAEFRALLWERPGTSLAPRHRGASPTQPSYFLRAKVCGEAIAVVGLCLMSEALPSRRMPNAHRELPGLHYGEKLCYVYELYGKAIPEPKLTLEHVLLLALLLAQGEQLQIARCAQCSELMLIDPLALARRLCVSCKASVPRAIILDAAPLSVPSIATAGQLAVAEPQLELF